MSQHPDSLRIFESGPEVRLAPYYERMCEPKPLRARTKPEWIRRREVVRQRTLAALGLDPMPDRLPLEIREGGVLEREGYRVRRLYWQTWPSVWASGWLYEPTELEGQTAAILNPHGHWNDGARSTTVQSRLISQAKLGYVALAPDSVHVYDYPTGVTPLTVMTLNNLRALDYLAARPDVDRTRLGVDGESGGAQQGMYLLAVDERIRAAVLAVLVTHFRRILFPEGSHCACNHVPGIMRFTDELELCAVSSPRAELFLTVTGDWTAAFPEHELGELLALYRLWLQPDRLGHRQFAGPHDYSQEMREAAYTWFERELRGNRKTEPLTEPQHQTEAPDSLTKLDRTPDGDRGTEGILEWYRKRVAAQPPQLDSKAARRTYQEGVQAELREVMGDPGEAVTLEAEWHDAETAPGTQRRVSFRSERDVRVPALWLPAPGPGPHPTLIAVHPEGKAAALTSPLVRGLAERGYSVLAPDVRLRGELHRDWLHNSIIWGRPEAGMAAHDVSTCVEWLLGREDVDPRSLVLLGEGDQGIAALIAAALDERISAVVADGGDTTYRDGGEGLPVIPNILRVADVPQIASLCATRPLWLYRVPAGRVGFSSRRYFDWTRRNYQAFGDEEALTLSTAGRPEADVLAEWLSKRLRRARK